MTEAWAEKYRPKNINDLIFPNEQLKLAVEQWYKQGYIDSNVLLYGKAGTGKSSLIKILVNDFIKNPKDVFILGRKVEEVDNLGRWIESAPVASSCRIVVVEEADRLSNQAELLLKEKFMERYLQNKVVFLGATNNVHKIDPAVRTRYHIKANFNNLPIDQVIAHLKKVLDSEQVTYDEQMVLEFVNKNIGKGLRELLNLAQLASTTKTFDIKSISALGGVADESQIIQIVNYMIKYLLSTSKEDSKILAFYPSTREYYEQFGKYWEWVSSTLKNYSDIDYVHIMKELIDSEDITLDNKNIIINYLQDEDFKIYKNLHFIAMLGDVFKNISDLKNSA